MSEPLAMTAQHTLRFYSDAEDVDLAALELRRVEGHEALSTPYAFRLELSTTLDGGLSDESIDAWLARPCHFTFGDTQVSGILEEVRLLNTADPTNVGYEAVLVPRVAALAQTVGSRVFQILSVVDIIKSVLVRHGVPFEINTTSTYPVHEYVVQYAESDLAFISRLMEHWGIFYFFEQRPDGEVLVLADGNASCVKREGLDDLRFDPSPTSIVAGSVLEMCRTHRPRTGSLFVRDYNWRTPYADTQGHMTARMLQLRATAAVDASTGRGEQWRYGDHVKDEAEAATIATVRAQQMVSERVVYSGALLSPGISPGHRFEVVGMPLAELDQEYLLTRLEWSVTSGQGAAVSQRFEAIPFTIAYRPPLGTPKPSIAGFMHAVVDGEVHGAAAPIDALGRYKVLMPYDAAATPGGNSSRWVRMAQPSAGPHHGMHFPLHIGTEVAVIHLGGDPDRPVILGSVPNVDTISPVVTDNASMSRIRTRGSILIELEDDA